MTLRELRVSAGYTQEGAAKKIEVDQSAIAKWENGVNPPLLKYRKKLARLYGVTLDKLEEACHAESKSVD